MREIFESLCAEALENKWDLSKTTFVLHSFLFWTQCSKRDVVSVQYMPKNNAAARGQRGVFLYGDIEVPVFVNQHFREDIVVLCKDLETTARSISKKVTKE